MPIKNTLAKEYRLNLLSIKYPAKAKGRNRNTNIYELKSIIYYTKITLSKIYAYILNYIISTYKNQQIIDLTSEFVPLDKDHVYFTLPKQHIAAVKTYTVLS